MTSFAGFVESGYAETESPFLTAKARQWAHHLTLKSSLLSAVLLTLSFSLSFYEPLFFLSRFFLLFVYFLAGIPALISALKDLGRLDVNIDILMTLAAFLSVAIGSELEGGLLLVLFALSGAIEDSVTMRAKATLSQLRTLAPTQVSCVDKKGQVYERSIRDVVKGMEIIVKAGQVVPLDGMIVAGESSLNLVHLTGENLPIIKKVGDSAPAGARNLEGALRLEVTHTSEESTLAQLIELICQAQSAKPRLQRWIDRFSRTYALSIISLSLLFALTLPFFSVIPFLGVEGSIYRALAFLIAASPCALILALPIGYLSAISSCARRGILLKGGIILDALHTCRIIAFDKTGTLTTGELACISFEPLHLTFDTQQALKIAYGMEQNAVHPIARAICAYAKERGMTPATLTEFRSIPGKGLQANFEGIPVWIGRPEALFAIIPASQQAAAERAIAEAKAAGQLVASLIWGQEVYLFAFEDTVRPKMAQILAKLAKRFRLLMLTGDHQVSAERVAKTVGLSEFAADLTPEKKLSMVSALADREGLAMIGDGINDAPALSRATVGISMGKVGSSTAMDASDIILLHDNLELLDWLFDKAASTQLVIRQNIAISLIAICFATLPALFGWVPLWLAVVLHEGGTMVVGLNSLRLLR